MHCAVHPGRGRTSLFKLSALHEKGPILPAEVSAPQRSSPFINSWGPQKRRVSSALAMRERTVEQGQNNTELQQQ